MADTFPRQYARTRRLTLGEPRNLWVSPDGATVLFLRSQAGDDAVNCLWSLDVASGAEHLLVDPASLLADAEDLPAAERARRERAREQASGVVAFSADQPGRVIAFTIGGRLHVVEGAEVRELPVEGPVFDPRPDPTGRRVAYVRGRALCVVEIASGTVTVLATEEQAEVSWGAAEFIAAEEMRRFRGYWWAPDGEALAASRVDTTPVERRYIADPAHPEREPNQVAYPRAGTANADVTLHVLGLDGTRVELGWDRGALPYLAEVVWPTDGPLLLEVQSRDQRTLQVLAADPATGRTKVVAEDHDEAWVELVPGTPLWWNGRLVTCSDRDGARRLLVDGTPVTPPDLQVRVVLDRHEHGVLFAANPTDDATSVHVWRWDGATLTALTSGPGVHTAVAGGPVVVVRSSGLDHDGSVTTVLGGPVIPSRAETPLVQARPRITHVGARRLPVAVLLPAGTAPSARLPVLLDPYGGPHAPRVQAQRGLYLTSQWFADQGFAVVVIDGAGTPGRGSEWEREVHHDLAGPVLRDQVEGLHAIAAEVPQLDLSRVAIRGWSFGGFLAALAVLRRPDVFHAGVAGAPVTEWRLYDTHYTERYLGDPTADPDPYDASSLLPDAHRLERPLLLIHGLADDNVVAAHTLQLSGALLAAARPHEVLPLSGVTHMTPQEVVAENLLLLQLAFLRRALAL
ncbi:MAG TPA: prolyl oligopeptidase family serine peptidase [Acidimicrobiales bacterium]